jgi:hypothetical protein
VKTKDGLRELRHAGRCGGRRPGTEDGRHRHVGSPPTPCDDYLLGLSESHMARQIILHFRQGHPAALGRPAGRAILGLGPSRRLREFGLLFR